MIQRKILVVEDNMINREMLCDMLSSAYEVLDAENGQEALDVLKKYGEEISLILLDIVMPVMDGYTFLSHMRSDPSYSAIPVIVTTQSDSEADEVAALSHGATDFVSKPYKPQIILHRVASIIHLRETAAVMQRVQYDRLTGLYSKEFFYHSANDMIRKNPDQEYDIICSDIENFKLINDIYGIPSGDMLLCKVADVYKEVVGERGICGHLNADQFVCLVERRGQEYSDGYFAEINEKIRGLTDMKNLVMKWGVYQVKDRSLLVEQMFDRALMAARSIWGQYGKHFMFFDDEMHNKLVREQAITDVMETALEEDQFEVYLQPQYNIKKNCLSGAEALIRWNHPEWGFQSPGVFIPLFEKNGFITKLDQFVWRRACAVLQEWQERGYPDIPISVNVSRADIYNVNLPDILMDTIGRYKIPPQRLHLELTESAYTENPSQIIENVGRLRELGFLFEMDDFGSGYSSLNMLNNLPIDVLKLDMEFIRNETAKSVTPGILYFVIQMAHSMNLHTVAEGVETKEQLERLSAIDCDYVQGYYFAKPMPRGEFENFLKDVKK